MTSPFLSKFYFKSDVSTFFDQKLEFLRVKVTIHFPGDVTLALTKMLKIAIFRFLTPVLGYFPWVDFQV